MRITYLGTSEPSLSGGMISVLLTVDALRAAGHDAEVVASRPAPDWSPVDIPWRTVPDPFAEIEDRDVVITGWLAVDRAVAAGPALVGHLCAGYESHLWPQLAERVAAVYALPTLKLVVAPHLARTIAAEQGVEASFIGTSFVGDWFHPRPAGMAPERPRVLLVGADPSGPYAPVPFKGIAFSLEVCRRLRESGHDLELVRLAPRRDEWIDDPGVDEAHVGLRPEEAAAVYRTCDVYLSGSTAAEGLGKPAVEAALSGLACALPAIPSYAEIDQLGAAALMYAPEDADAAIARMSALLGDRDLRARLGAAGAGLELAETFSPAAVADRLVAAIRSKRGPVR